MKHVPDTEPESLELARFFLRDEPEFLNDDAIAELAAVIDRAIDQWIARKLLCKLRH